MQPKTDIKLEFENFGEKQVSTRISKNIEIIVLREKIAQLEGISPRRVKIVNGGDQELKDGKSLTDYSLSCYKPSKKLLSTASSTIRKPPRNITARRKLKIDIWDFASVEGVERISRLHGYDLKQIIWEQTGIEPTFQRIESHARRLKDNETISHFIQRTRISKFYKEGLLTLHCNLKCFVLGNNSLGMNTNMRIPPKRLSKTKRPGTSHESETGGRTVVDCGHMNIFTNAIYNIQMHPTPITQRKFSESPPAKGIIKGRSKGRPESYLSKVKKFPQTSMNFFRGTGSGGRIGRGKYMGRKTVYKGPPVDSEIMALLHENAYGRMTSLQPAGHLPLHSSSHMPPVVPPVIIHPPQPYTKSKYKYPVLPYRKKQLRQIYSSQGACGGACGGAIPGVNKQRSSLDKEKLSIGEILPQREHELHIQGKEEILSPQLRVQTAVINASVSSSNWGTETPANKYGQESTGSPPSTAGMVDRRSQFGYKTDSNFWKSQATHRPESRYNKKTLCSVLDSGPLFRSEYMVPVKKLTFDSTLKHLVFPTCWGEECLASLKAPVGGGGLKPKGPKIRNEKQEMMELLDNRYLNSNKETAHISIDSSHSNSEVDLDPIRGNYNDL